MKKTMKKITALAMASAMVISMGITVYADETEAETTVASMEVENTKGDTVTVYDQNSVTIIKNYNLTNASNESISPAETFRFTVNTKKHTVVDAAVGITDKNMPMIEDSDISTAVYLKGEAGKTTEVVDEETGDTTVEKNYAKEITVNLPEYTGVGVYTYYINEIEGNTAGVTYFAGEIKLVVTVLQDDAGKIRVAAVHAEDTAAQNATKTNQFENIYSAGQLAVSKTVTGNMGDQTKDFTVTVSFEAPYTEKGDSKEYDVVKSDITYNEPVIEDGKVTTATQTIDAESGWTTKSVDITLKHGETITFTNIPYGVTYTVKEADYTTVEKGEYDRPDYNAENVITKDITENDTTVTIEDYAKGVVDTANQERVSIVNNKGVTVDTGISLDALPYLMMLGMSGLGALGFAGKRRKEEDEI